jgi:hypothetical protein
MVKKTSPKLDAFGLFLPSRMGTTVSPAIMQRGLNLGETVAVTDSEEVADDKDEEITEEAKVDEATPEAADMEGAVAEERQVK